MNYIKSLNDALATFYDDARLNPTHVSLYLALFQEWNNCRFAGHFNVSRQVLMHTSKIGSPSTYQRCIRELDTWGYINYYPSYNPMKGSKVEMIDLNPESPPYGNYDPELERLAEEYHPKSEQLRDYKNTSSEQVMNNKPSISERAVNSKPFNTEQLMDGSHPTSEQQMGSSTNSIKQDKPIKRPKDSTKVERFFNANESDTEQGRKFFNYYKSNNWRTSNGSPVRDWKALARSWIRRAQDFTQYNSDKKDHLKISKDKNYGQPL